MERIVVNTEKMSPSEEYVCWLDIMGTQTSMSESFEKSANFILRFHTAVLKAKISKKIRVYPVMDGVYVVVKKLENMMRCIDRIMTVLAEVFLSEENNHRFMVKGAVAKGTLHHGSKISPDVSSVIATKTEYKEHLLFGLPMIQAYRSEKKAPPFGVYIHESARTVNGLQGRYYFWNRDNTISDKENLQAQLKEELCLFLDWEKDRSYYFEMEPSKLTEYKERIKEYFTMIEDGR